MKKNTPRIYRSNLDIIVEKTVNTIGHALPIVSLSLLATIIINLIIEFCNS